MSENPATPGHTGALYGSTPEERDARLDAMWEAHLALAKRGNMAVASWQTPTPDAER